MANKEPVETNEKITQIRNERDSFDVKDGKRCEGLSFVITGKVHTFNNRDEFTTYVKSQGGRVSGSVSKDTDYLVNNDLASTATKNKKAKELGTKIITEDQFIERFGH